MLTSILPILIYNCVLAVTLLISFALPTKTVAHEIDKQYTHVLGGDECNVQNPTTENAAALRKVDGTIENISDDLQATISCPIPVAIEQSRFGRLETDIVINFLNSHPTEEQKFSCNVSGNIIVEGPELEFARYWNSSDIDSGGEGSIRFRNDKEIPKYFLVGLFGGDLLRRPTITCGLPPKSVIVSVIITTRLT